MTSAPHPLSVLIVDDDDFMCELLTEMLNALGVKQVQCVADGNKALRWLRQADYVPSLLISDIYMPDMDGFEFIQSLVSMDYRGPVLLCSGVSIENLSLAYDVAADSGLPIVGAMPKPLSADNLATVIDKIRPKSA